MKEKTFNRYMLSEEAVDEFAYNILEIDDDIERREAVNKILLVEKQMIEFNAHKTIADNKYRNKSFLSCEKRKELRKVIHNELINKIRLDDEKEIKLGCGGALPQSGNLKKEKTMYFIMGLPASGKSGLANVLSDNTGAVIIDSDMAKRKFPEYDSVDGGASLVHEESVLIVLSGKEENLLKTCVEDGINIIIPRIGNKIDTIIDLTKKLKNTGYTAYLILVELDRLKATQRAYYRFITDHRYVQLSMIFDSFANDPILNYYKIRKHHSNVFNGYAHINTDVEKENPNKIIEDKNINLLKNGLLNEYKTGRVNYE